jgi:hypothetical protein
MRQGLNQAFDKYQPDLVVGIVTWCDVVWCGVVWCVGG